MTRGSPSASKLNSRPHSPVSPLEENARHVPKDGEGPYYSSVPLHDNGRALQTTSDGIETGFELSTFGDVWYIEILSLIASVAAFGALIALLAVYDGKEQPDWTNISLNTAISFLSMISKGLLLIPVSRALGQLKWSWVEEKSRPLSGLRTFDLASRGVIGCFDLIGLTKGLHLSTLGCLAVILALGFDPFVQNLVRYYPKSVPDATQQARVANASLFDSVGTLVGDGVQNINPSVKANIYNSILNVDPSEPWSIPQYTCTTGNCTFPPLVTLVARPRCEDISSMLKMECGHLSNPNNCSIGIEEGVSMNFVSAGGTHMNISSVRNPRIYDTDALLNLFPVFQYVMAQDDGLLQNRNYSLSNTTTKFVATECVLEFCAQKVQDSVSESRYQQTALNEPWCEYNMTGSPSPHVTINPPWAPPGYTSKHTVEYRKGKEWVKEEFELQFGLEQLAFLSLKQYLAGIFSGWVMGIAGALDYRPVDPPSFTQAKVGAAADVIEAVFLGNISGCGHSDDHLTCAMNNVGKAITKSFRDNAYIANGAENADMTGGETMVVATFVRIEWVWLILPAIVLAAGVVFFFAVILVTHRAALPLWGNNILPLLFLLRETKENDKVPMHGTTNVAYWHKARQYMVHLEHDKDSARLS
ncbi:hypothetical protein BU24DRAFT_424693 [Aaosphaeria arxii CBS 175.79]|uniref:Uncharacterized protein n=1 Tax=Aaosphaeria arxii CBS 175.79 TaxID=1450172 RepID=A0A6A5XKA8_9PLEO|nr:uncharacterized protein BU24DRAFT_424693 [Aaosphaeria arxii CBS 175.79]KAF2013685.1 hypothetical protein BU24DRAFT_424693 [Aaosphaeria arxii CBS 175.79]